MEDRDRLVRYVEDNANRNAVGPIPTSIPASKEVSAGSVIHRFLLFYLQVSHGWALVGFVDHTSAAINPGLG